MKLKPNLFDYATSELSQDAFLTWLIQWADKDYREVDSFLNACAISFVQELLGKDKSYSIETVEAGRQWNNIDVWALVNNKYFLVIEDKKGTKEHSDQLIRYSELSKKHYEKSDIDIKLVYFKMEEQGKYRDIKEAGFSLFQRSKMLLILEDYINSTERSQQNDIIVDYYNNLDNLDKKIKSYLNKPLNEWHWYSWQGFYSELQKHIGGNWEYVANAAGGFLGFWWNWNYSKIDGREFEYYLQLEQDRFVFKLYSYKENDRREVRDFYRRHLYKKAKELNLGISQFGRLGAYMGVAKLNSEYRLTYENGLLDFQATVENLKGLMKLINETEKEITALNTLYS
ncbi:MAG: PD-(D/E)XK nuclease family protein [Altibacter sp.]|uniref:PD-(D/E)XK nuclease family protein n=1 Tax=Altibacter sp. TaxID=2024823 RepID=UPI001E1169E5|nr:PD-(D/E)XK nuclease family protein [Altibacter sp.]MBZ0328292.1 PD-(D/E)XK nuclease family protein [Altibacter sp.]